MKFGLIKWLLLLSLMSLVGCSKAEDRFSGNWSGTQATIEVGADIELSHYNYWTINNGTIQLSSYYWVREEGGYVRKFDETTTKTYAYEWKSDNEIRIGGESYEVEVGKTLMKVSNDQWEVEFERD